MCFVMRPFAKQVHRETNDNNTYEFRGNVEHFLRVFFLRARAWTKHDGQSKLRNGVWFEQGALNKIVLAADATRKVVKQQFSKMRSFL